MAGHVRGPAGRRDAVLERRVLPAAADRASSWRSWRWPTRETERWRRKFGMTPARSSCARRRRRRSASGRSTSCGTGRFGNYGWAHNTDDHRRLRPRVGRQARGSRRCATCPASSSSTCSPTTSTRTACGGSPTRRSTRSSPRSGRSRRRRSATSPASAEDGSIRGGGAGEVDPIENLSRFHYLKELFLDSATTATVLSCVPTSPDTEQPAAASPRRPRRSTRSTTSPSSQRCGACTRS